MKNQKDKPVVHGTLTLMIAIRNCSLIREKEVVAD
jgi:hypothetical protein